MTIGILVVDDNELLRAGLVAVLSSDPELAVVAQAADGPAAVRLAVEHRPDIVLMDIEMPGGDGITATRNIGHSVPTAKVLILTMFDLDEYVLEALRAGASGFLLKTSGPAELVNAVKACAAGEYMLSRPVMARLIDSYVTRPAPPPTVPGLADLTHREMDVLRAMAGGLTNAEIAVELHLAETTVKTHVAHILAKLGARDRVQAIVIAHRSGIAGP
jgi:DNA-binding NarL/FixJ family response regulator